MVENGGGKLKNLLRDDDIWRPVLYDKTGFIISHSLHTIGYLITIIFLYAFKTKHMWNTLWFVEIRMLAIYQLIQVFFWLLMWGTDLQEKLCPILGCIDAGSVYASTVEWIIIFVTLYMSLKAETLNKAIEDKALAILKLCSYVIPFCFFIVILISFYFGNVFSSHQNERHSCWFDSTENNYMVRSCLGDLAQYFILVVIEISFLAINAVLKCKIRRQQKRVIDPKTAKIVRSNVQMYGNFFSNFDEEIDYGYPTFTVYQHSESDSRYIINMDEIDNEIPTRINSPQIIIPQFENKSNISIKLKTSIPKKPKIKPIKNKNKSLKIEQSYIAIVGNIFWFLPILHIIVIVFVFVYNFLANKDSEQQIRIYETFGFLFQAGGIYFPFIFIIPNVMIWKRKEKEKKDFGYMGEGKKKPSGREMKATLNVPDFNSIDSEI